MSYPLCPLLIWSVEGFLATIKSLHGMAGLQWLNPVPTHPASAAGACYITHGSCSKRAKRGCTWGGASRAATKASHRSGSSWKLCPVGQRFSRAGQGAFEHEIGDTALRRRRCPLQGLIGPGCQPEIQLLAPQGG